MNPNALRCCKVKNHAIYLIQCEQNPLGFLLLTNLYNKRSFSELLLRLNCNEDDLAYYLTILVKAELVGYEYTEENIGAKVIYVKNFVITKNGKKILEKINKKSFIPKESF